MSPKGWHSRGYLPHFDSPETLQFVTVRLVDSLPAEAIEKLRLGVGTATTSEWDAFLDAGAGECWLKRPEIAQIVEAALLHFDGERYRLIAWTIMPDHVHVLVELSNQHSLESVVSSWKRFSARMADQLIGRSGPFWQDDYWDTYIRDERHFESTVGYIENNPVKAGFVSAAEDWLWSHLRHQLATDA